MKIKPALVALSVAAAAAIGVSAAPLASAETEVEYLGQPAELVDGNVIQHWTVTGLKPSTDTIPYQAAGTLWEATATDEAIAGSATPIVSNLNARAGNGEPYRVLFGAAPPQGANASTLPQGEKTTGKIYFDVTGEQPDSVVYNAGGTDLLLWVEPPPAPTTDSAAAGSSPAQVYASPSDSSDTAETATPATPTPGAEPAAATPAPTAATATPAPAGSSGTPLPEGSSGTPLPEGSSGTPLPEGAGPAAEASPAPAPAAVAPEGSSGTPLPEGSSGTPAPAGPTPTTTVVAPAPAA